ncbi:MAG: TRAP transporter substrate-binding protein DctP [Aquisalimonadaceae bacterium]
MKLRHLLIGAVTAAVIVAGISTASAQTTLRLSTLFNPASSGGLAAEEFAKRVGERSNGRIKVNVYPASQLGDWTEVHAQLMQGAVDMAIQPLSTSFNTRLAISWFPYLTPTYDSAVDAYSEGGYVATAVNELIGPQNLRLLGVYGAGMGGAGFARDIDSPGDPDATRSVRIRVWPGGTTHRALMQRLGYNVATVPWAELYTAMQTGVVDGQIGGTPEMAMDNFKDITRTWIQYNDHFELAWIVMNRPKYESLSEADRQVILDVAQEITRERFEEVREADAKDLDRMREAGIEVVTFSDQELENFARVARTDVWPQIGGELGDEIMGILYKAVGMDKPQ